MEIPPQPGDADPAGKRLWSLLNLENTQHSLLARVKDMYKNLQGVKNDLESMRLETDYIVQKEATIVMQSMDSHTKNLEDSQRLQTRANSSLELMQVILAGSLTFDIVDRVTTFYMSINHFDGNIPGVFKWLVETPGAWFFLNIGVWMAFGFCLLKYMRHQVEVATGILSYRFVLNKKVDHDNFMAFLDTKDIGMQDSCLDEGKQSRTRKVQWIETDHVKWRHTMPIFDVWYNTDPANCLIYKVFVQVERGPNGEQVWNEQAIQDAFEGELVEADVCSSINSLHDDWMDKSNLHNPWKLRRASTAAR